MYHDIFVGEFNIHSGYCRSHTCGTCDELKLQIEQASSDSEKASLENDHLSLAKAGYDTLRYNQELSKKTWEAACMHSGPIQD
jgi:hypothetical protein